MFVFLQFVTTPICCPSRSSILTGLYAHNHGTVNNSRSGGCGNSSIEFESRTFANILHLGGYKTFYAGKYLNQVKFLIINLSSLKSMKSIVFMLLSFLISLIVEFKNFAGVLKA